MLPLQCNYHKNILSLCHILYAFIMRGLWLLFLLQSWNYKKTHFNNSFTGYLTKYFKLYSLSNLFFTITLEDGHFNPHIENSKHLRSLLILKKIKMLVNGRIIKNNENLLKIIKSWTWKMLRLEYFVWK